MDVPELLQQLQNTLGNLIRLCRSVAKSALLRFRLAAKAVRAPLRRRPPPRGARRGPLGTAMLAQVPAVSYTHLDVYKRQV